MRGKGLTRDKGFVSIASAGTLLEYITRVHYLIFHWLTPLELILPLQFKNLVHGEVGHSQ